MHKIDYVNEEYRQLQHPKHYLNINNLLYPETSPEISEILLNLKNQTKSNLMFKNELFSQIGK